MTTIAVALVFNLLITALLYGLYVTSFALCLRWLILADEGWALRKNIDKGMTSVAVLIFVSSTMNLGARTQFALNYVVTDNLRHIYEAEAMSVVTSSVVFLITDATMIYRCWVVYSKSWLAVFLPVLFWLGYMTAFILVVYYNHISYMSTYSIAIIQSLRYANMALYPCNLATVIYTTTAIIYRVLRAAKARNGSCSRQLIYLCRLLAVTGIIYILSTILVVITYSLSSLDVLNDLTMNYVVISIYYSMAGIVFNVVLAGVGQNRVNGTGGQVGLQLDQVAVKHHDCSRRV